MDRLLNDAEVCKICRSGCDRIEATQCDWRDKDECHNLIVAQLSKADKDWAQWAESKCPHDGERLKRQCTSCWWERKGALKL